MVADGTRFDFDRSGNNHTITTKEKWGYRVPLENRAFKTIDRAEVQYRQFKLDDTYVPDSGLSQSPACRSACCTAGRLPSSGSSRPI